MKTYTHNLLSAAVVAAITFSGAAIADEYQTLETTTVTAGRFEQDLMETPMSVSVSRAPVDFSKSFFYSRSRHCDDNDQASMD